MRPATSRDPYGLGLPEALAEKALDDARWAYPSAA